MNELLLDKLEQLYKEASECDEIQRLLELKNKIYNNKKLRELLDKYRNSFNKYDSSFIQLKKEIINDPLISEYREIEDKLYFITLEINQKLNGLIDKKGCSNENN